jgi:putative acetyltransferase
VKIREFQPNDSAATAELFRDTIRRINSQDYSPDQIRAWASEDMDVGTWCSTLERGHTLLIESTNDELLGFITAQLDGNIHLLYVHADHQRQGLGSRLLSHAKEYAQLSGIKRLCADASITARPFFERHGFFVTQEQRLLKRGVDFVNYFMEKHL